MTNTIIKLAGLTLACSALIACDPDFDDPVGKDSNNSRGDADFTTFVSIGDSLTAGYADGALYLTGQQNSYPAILARQFELVDGGTFSQPVVDDNFGGLLAGGAPLLDDDDENLFPTRLVLNAAPKDPPDDLDPVGPENIEGTPTTDIVLTSLAGTGAYNNMGVPGAKSFHLVSTDYGNLAALPNANPFYIRFASATDASMIADAAGQQPSFFVMWVGNNDVLSYATSGGDGEDQTGNFDAASYGPDDITDPNVFAGVYDQLVTAMTAAGGKGVLINIPDVSTIPYFTTVPHNPVPLDQDSADALNAAYSAYNEGLLGLQQAMLIDADEVAQRTISFSPGLKNAVVIEDEELTDLGDFGLPSMRQATAEDLLILTARSKIGTEAVEGNPATLWGLGVPLEDEDVLTPEEIDAIDTARTAYNSTIAGIADASDNLILVDSAALMSDIQDGYNYGTGYVESTYATGGAFSLDGVHPTQRGYAIVANTIIDAINTGFNASIPLVDPGAYSTIFVK